MNSTTEAKALEGSDGGTKRLGSLLYASWSSFPVILQPMSRHYSEPLSPGNDCPLNGIARDRYRGLDQHIDYVYLQSWAKSQNQKYWVIERKAMPCHRSDGKSPILSRRGVHGLHKDLVSPPGNEQNIATILKLVDIMMDRCEETAPEDRKRLAGIRLRTNQAHYLDAIWNHEALIAYNLAALDAICQSFEGNMGNSNGDQQRNLSSAEDNSSDGDSNEGSDKEAEEDYEEPGLQEEGADILNDGMTGITGEAGDDEDTDGEEASAGNEIPVPRESAAELLELLFGLSLALCTEPLTDSLPSSTVLVYFSGILDFSTSLQTFLPARSYTSYLKINLPSEAVIPEDGPSPSRVLGSGYYPPPQDYTTRKVGANSQKVYGVRLFLCWSDDEFRLLSDYIVEQTTRLCYELMFDWEASVNLAEVKDDMTNTENDFSFIKHPENNLQDAYLELCERACTARRDSLSRRGRWNWQAVFKYVEKEEALREFLGLGVLMLGGQGPRWPDVCSLWCTNGEFAAGGIYIYNVSMIYVVRHHKAKVSIDTAG
ncbi:hypothetical protein B0T10DRAFT_553204 [Thelonectria olida]|uniref:Uncharacterized protein n=1 Tax=Thelonectria olida TaxID=1576542 RepID=A0A9P9AKU1_9HYPO|nr:hypothetical protein B0T10DRAFT_553204 [Thelonectria olida]